MKTTKQKPVHRGKALKKVAEESGLTVDEIIERMRYASRTTYYNHTRNPRLSLTILGRYGKIFKHGFYEIPEMKLLTSKESAVFGPYFKLPVTLDEAIKQLDFYYMKYMLQLEEIRKLLEENGELKYKLSKYI